MCKHSSYSFEFCVLGGKYWWAIILHSMLTGISSLLSSKKTTQIEEPLPLADSASNFGEGRQLGDIFLHHSKWNGFYPVLTPLKEAITMLTKIYHNDTYCCLDTFMLESWLKHSIWHVFAKQFCVATLNIHQQGLHHMCKIIFYYISKNLYIRAVKNYTDLYCEITWHWTRKITFKFFKNEIF